MKLVTQEQLQAHAAASRRGAAEGTVFGAALATTAMLWAKQRYAGYNKLPFSLKALGAVIIVAPCLAIQGERRGLEYDRSQWEGEGSRILDQKEVMAAKRWGNMSLAHKIGDWSLRHQYTLIIGGWASSLAIAGGIISRQKYQSYAQKIVQARMWAQGLTIGLLIVAGALSQQRRAAVAQEGNNDHSWRDVLDQQERDRQLEQAALKQVAAA